MPSLEVMITESHGSKIFRICGKLEVLTFEEWCSFCGASLQLSP